MAGAMGQTRQPIARAPPCLLIVAADGVIDASDGYADFRGLKSNLLTALDGVPDLALSRIRFAKDPGAGNVGLIALNCAAAVHEDHRPVAYLLRLLRAMR